MPLDRIILSERVPILVEALFLGLRVQVAGKVYSLDDNHVLREHVPYSDGETRYHLCDHFTLVNYVGMIERQTQAEFEKMVLETITVKYKTQEDS